MMNFFETMRLTNNKTTTTNGDLAYKSSLNGLMDFTFLAAQARTHASQEVCQLFHNAYLEDKVAAIRLLFYVRDVRGGQGERSVFRNCMTWLIQYDPTIAKQVLAYVPKYGRWDDLVFIYSAAKAYGLTEIHEYCVTIIRTQLILDLTNINTPERSLLGKWLPSENTSSKTTRQVAKMLRKDLGMTSQTYRQHLSELRRSIKIVETAICQTGIDSINYNAVPSKAMMRYKDLFLSKDNYRFNEYIVALCAEDPAQRTKVNAATLYPYDIVHAALCGTNEPALLDAQWNALPDFFEGKFDNSIVVADVSGSMDGKPMEVCIGLAIYIAERNKGAYHNKFITFSQHPELHDVCGENICEKIVNLDDSEWSMNTDIDAVFQLMYDSAVDNAVPQDELPSRIYIVSDMQFDEADNSEHKVTVFQKWQQLFSTAGYTLPTVIFWNVSDEGDTVPITIHDTGAVLCSGASPAVCKFLMEGGVSDTHALIRTITESERYSCILANNHNTTV